MWAPLFNPSLASINYSSCRCLAHDCRLAATKFENTKGRVREVNRCQHNPCLQKEFLYTQVAPLPKRRRLPDCNPSDKLGDKTWIGKKQRNNDAWCNHQSKHMEGPCFPSGVLKLRLCLLVGLAKLTCLRSPWCRDMGGPIADDLLRTTGVWGFPPRPMW